MDKIQQPDQDVIVIDRAQQPDYVSDLGLQDMIFNEQDAMLYASMQYFPVNSADRESAKTAFDLLSELVRLIKSRTKLDVQESMRDSISSLSGSIRNETLRLHIERISKALFSHQSDIEINYGDNIENFLTIEKSFYEAISPGVSDEKATKLIASSEMLSKSLIEPFKTYAQSLIEFARKIVKDLGQPPAAPEQPIHEDAWFANKGCKDKAPKGEIAEDICHKLHDASDKHSNIPFAQKLVLIEEAECIARKHPEYQWDEIQKAKEQLIVSAVSELRKDALKAIKSKEVGATEIKQFIARAKLLLDILKTDSGAKSKALTKLEELEKRISSNEAMNTISLPIDKIGKSHNARNIAIIAGVVSFVALAIVAITNTSEPANDDTSSVSEGAPVSANAEPEPEDESQEPSNLVVPEPEPSDVPVAATVETDAEPEQTQVAAKETGKETPITDMVESSELESKLRASFHYKIVNGKPVVTKVTFDTPPTEKVRLAKKEMVMGNVPGSNKTMGGYLQFEITDSKTGETRTFFLYHPNYFSSGWFDGEDPEDNLYTGLAIYERKQN